MRVITILLTVLLGVVLLTGTMDTILGTGWISMICKLIMGITFMCLVVNLLSHRN